MPNLIRAPSMPSVPSIPCLASPVYPPSHGPSSLPAISCLRSSQSFDSSNGLARLQSSSKTLFLKSMNKSAKHGSFLFMSECRALFSEGMAISNAVIAILSLMLDLLSSNCSLAAFQFLPQASSVSESKAWGTSPPLPDTR